MADSKITALAELTDPDDVDLLLAVDSPAGTPVSKKLPIGTLMARAYAAIYVSEGAGSQTLSGLTWTQLTQFATNGESKNATPDQANDEITIDDAGTYLVFFDASFQSDAINEVAFRCSWNSVAQEQLKGSGTVPGAGETISVSFCGILNASAAGNDLDVYAYVRDSGGGDVDVIEAHLVAVRLF